MANLFSGQPKVIPEFTGLQVNTSVSVMPVPIIYGSPRTTINLIYYNGFNSQLVSEGGKGLLTGGKGSEQVEYFATIILAIGEGELSAPLIIYQDAEVWTPATFPSNGAYYYNGSAVQTPWPYAASLWPADARSYKDTAYYGFSNAQLDSSATVPQINLVVQGFFTGSSPLNNTTITISTGQYDPNGNPLSFIGNIACGDMDADPALCILDFLTNVTYGATFPLMWIDTSTLLTTSNGYDAAVGDNALSTFCQAVGLAWSVAVNNAESANSILERWAKNLNVAIVWNGAQLQFIPYWDTFVANNPGYDASNPQAIGLKYFNPWTVPLVTITMDQILQSESKDEDPITFTRKDPWKIYNTVRLDFNDRTNFFNDVPAEAKDEANAELYGPVVDNIGLADEFTLGAYANVSAQMQLARNISIRRNFSWKMGPLWGWLTPMNIVNIPDPVNYANLILVRIISAEDDEDENVTLTAEELLIGSQSPAVALPLSPSTPPNQGATNSPPSPITPPVMFAPTTAMLTATGFAGPQWIFGCSATFDGLFDPNWGGCNIWVSLDNVSYQLIGKLSNPATFGGLSAPLAGYGGANPDTSQTVYVNLSASDTVLPSFSSALASSGYSLCILQDVSGFELFTYTTATLVGPNTYALTGLYRGFYGTAPRAFGAGSAFMLVGTAANFFEISLPASYDGQLFYVKGQSFNVFHTATESLTDCVAYPYLATGPTPPSPAVPPTQAATYRRVVRQAKANVIRRKKNGTL